MQIGSKLFPNFLSILQIYSGPLLLNSFVPLGWKDIVSMCAASQIVREAFLAETLL